jgi:hypothetical protein
MIWRDARDGDAFFDVNVLADISGYRVFSFAFNFGLHSRSLIELDSWLETHVFSS